MFKVLGSWQKSYVHAATYVYFDGSAGVGGGIFEVQMGWRQKLFVFRRNILGFFSHFDTGHPLINNNQSINMFHLFLI